MLRTPSNQIGWDNSRDIADTTKFYAELWSVGWDIPTVVAQLKTGEYVWGNGHSTKCGNIVSKEVLRKHLLDEFNSHQDEMAAIQKLLTETEK